MMKIFSKLALLISVSFLLGGCLYPKAEKSKNQIPYTTQIEIVQSAVNQFQKDEDGILPIKTKNAKTPIYHKYVIDFSKLSPRYMAEPPESAFESGGYFQYVLVNVEQKPTVKLLDVRISQAIQDLSLRLNAYVQRNGYPPFKERLAKNVFTLDYQKLGLKDAPTVTSPYSQKQLHLILDGKGEIYVDYTPDLNDILKKNEVKENPDEDIRDLLVRKSEFVPAYSLAYKVDAKQRPVFLEK